MELATFARALRNFCRRRKFFPFYVQLTSGDRLLVPHPEALVIHNGLAVFVRQDNGYHALDSASVCQLYDQDLEPFELGQVSGSPGEGQGP